MFAILEFDLGRNALRYIVQMYKIKEIHIPYYLCDVVRHTLVEESCKPMFYHIDDNFLPDCEFNKDDYILYPNYWGVCGKNVKKLADIYPKLIVDNAHAYYDTPSGFACFNAGHKFGFKESYLWVKDETSVPQPLIFTGDKVRREKFLALHEKYKSVNLFFVIKYDKILLLS